MIEFLAPAAPLLQVNKEPYEGGWMIKVKLSNPAEASALMDSAQYLQHAEGGGH
jgi:glycine cleavage system H lipoate-binding protein